MSDKAVSKKSAAVRRDPQMKCEVCGAQVSLHGEDALCWVCKRLKISAWRDSDLQAPAQE